MSLARTMLRRRRRQPPRVLQRLVRVAALLYVRQTGVAAGMSEAAQVRDVKRAIERGELSIELDETRELIRVRPTWTAE